MAEDWLADVRKYDPDADETVVGAIVRHCGIALRNRDSSLVSFSDPTETGRVRDNFLKKKLGRTEDDATLDGAIAAVGDRMRDDRTKNRVTVYYLLADRFGSLNAFGGPAAATGAATDGGSTAGALAGGAAGLAAVGATAPAFGGSAAADPRAAAAAPRASAPRPLAGSPGRARAAGGYGSPMAISIDDINWGWVAVLAGGILLAALLAMGLAQMRHGPPPAPTYTAAAPALPAAPVALPSAPVPQGAGVVASDRDAKPMLTIYFDTGKAAVSDQFASAAAAVKTYVDAHPDASLAVSGFNDPTGNAAANAELSKNRAKNTKAALEQLGVAAERVVLEKPAETTGTGATNTESRRVEVVIKE